MAGYESAQLIESLHEEGAEQVEAKRQRVVPWRRVGLAAAVVATLGAAVGTSLRSKPPTPAQRWYKMRNSLLEAFSSRALAEVADLTTRINFTFAEEGQEDPSEMSIDAKFETTDAEVEKLTFKMVFAAQEGKGEDLVNQFRDVVSGVKTYVTAMTGEDAGAMIDGMVTVEAGEEDEAVITIVPPVPDEKKEEMAKGLKAAPRFTASLKTGRDIVQMYKHAGDNIAMLPHGVSGHVDAAFSSMLMSVAEPPPPPWLAAMALVDMNYVFRYRAGDDVAEAFDVLPNLKQAVDMFAVNFANGPASILEPTHGLADLADGVKSVEISGLPNKYGILFTFKNFHIVPILKDMIDDIDAHRPDPGSFAVSTSSEPRPGGDFGEIRPRHD